MNMPLHLFIITWRSGEPFFSGIIFVNNKRFGTLDGSTDFQPDAVKKSFRYG